MRQEASPDHDTLPTLPQWRQVSREGKEWSWKTISKGVTRMSLKREKASSYYVGGSKVKGWPRGREIQNDL